MFIFTLNNKLNSVLNASDYRKPGITQDLYFKENQFEGSIICFLG